MGLFRRKPVESDGYEHATVVGYIDEEKMATLLGAGWEVEHVEDETYRLCRKIEG